MKLKGLRRFSSTLLAALVIVLVVSGPSQALAIGGHGFAAGHPGGSGMHHGFDGHHGFVGHHGFEGHRRHLGFVPVFPYYGYYGYYPPEYGYEAPSYWYYCPNYRAYYPSVESCPEAWVPIPAS